MHKSQSADDGLCTQSFLLFHLEAGQNIPIANNLVKQIVQEVCKNDYVNQTSCLTA